MNPLFYVLGIIGIALILFVLYDMVKNRNKKEFFEQDNEY